MKVLFSLVLALFFTVNLAQAGVIVGGTRLIYDGSKKESSLSVKNPDKSAYLIQSWIEAGTDAEKAPFIITPPLFRLDGGNENLLRIVRAGGNLPNDKESLFWMNIKSIPSMEQDSSKDTLQIAVKTRIKLLYRPEGLKGEPEEFAESLSWQRVGNEIQVTNPTPFYMNFQKVNVGGKEVKEATYVAPGATARFALPANTTAGNVSWALINDYGGTGKEHTKKL